MIYNYRRIKREASEFLEDDSEGGTRKLILIISDDP